MPERDRDIIYGINPAFEVLRAGRRTVHEVLLNEGSARNPRVKKLVSLLERLGIKPTWIDKGRLQNRAKTRDHQGVLLTVSPYPYVPFADLLQLPRVVLVDNVEDPHNIGAILRSAEVLGFDGVMLPRRGVPLILPSVIKASAGACEHLQISCNGSANQYVKVAKAEGFCVAALDGKGEETVEALARLEAEKLLVVVGGEDRGVGQFIRNEADLRVRIEQRGRINSLNASVAAAIALHAASKARQDGPAEGGRLADPQ